MRYSVPFYMGGRLDGLEVPPPHTLVDPPLPDGAAMDRMAVLYAELAGLIENDPDLPVVYAGDCCVILGVLAGLQRKGTDPVLVFYDAHGDFNTWETTPSGFIGGMPLAMATGRGEQTLVAAAKMHPLVDHDAFLVDGRDLDPKEAVLLSRSGVRRVEVAEIASVVPADRPLYVHVDVDVVDPAELPAINYPAPGGPSADVTALSLATLAATGRVAAYSVSTWNPALPGADVAARVTNRISAPFLV